MDVQFLNSCCASLLSRAIIVVVVWQIGPQPQSLGWRRLVPSVVLEQVGQVPWTIISSLFALYTKKDYLELHSGLAMCNQGDGIFYFRGVCQIAYSFQALGRVAGAMMSKTLGSV